MPDLHITTEHLHPARALLWIHLGLYTTLCEYIHDNENPPDVTLPPQERRRSGSGSPVEGAPLTVPRLRRSGRSSLAPALAADAAGLQPQTAAEQVTSPAGERALRRTSFQSWNQNSRKLVVRSYASIGNFTHQHQSRLGLTGHI